MTTHTFKTELWLPEKRDRVFPFFADARNLTAITPPWLDFNILTPQPIKMAPGVLIDYRLRVHGVPIRWRTRIAKWNPPHSFVDEQTQGPYRLWVHTHTFEESAGGTLCRDSVNYAVPGGAFINWLLVRHDVRKIFAFRNRTLASLFPGGVLKETDIAV
jgi:ligand-binding SRPBCC domain-containing protein